MSPTNKPLVWLHGEIKTPPFSPRIVDEAVTWRVIYRIDPDAVVIAEVFSKKTKQTPNRVIDTAKSRLRAYDDAAEE